MINRAGRSFSRFGSVAALTASLLTGCATAGGVRPVLPTTSDRFFVAGYHPYWAGDSWTAYPLELLDELYYFELEAGADGTIADPHGWPSEWEPMVQAARAADVQLVPTISMHDPDAFEALFPARERVARLVESVLDVASSTPGLSGVHLDFEVFQPVSDDARDGFTAFVAQLADRLDRERPDLSLSVFALAFDFDDAYNERALGQIADFLVVQGYDFHSAGSENAGPVGATTGWGILNWDYVVRRFRDFGVPARKLVMAVPLYGYEWPVESEERGAAATDLAETVPYTAPEDVLPTAPRIRDRVARYGLERDPESESPYYTFRDDRGWVQGWFEDAQSLRAKYDFVRSRGLGGIAIFPLAYGDEELWADLRSAFTTPR